MMKKSRLTRLFSLFAALMMCVSLLSAVASASDSGIQPHGPSCPACNNGPTRWLPNITKVDKFPCGTCPHDDEVAHYRITEYEVLHCDGCGIDNESYIRSGITCRKCGNLWY